MDRDTPSSSDGGNAAPPWSIDSVQWDAAAMVRARGARLSGGNASFPAKNCVCRSRAVQLPMPRRRLMRHADGCARRASGGHPSARAGSGWQFRRGAVATAARGCGGRAARATASRTPAARHGMPGASLARIEAGAIPARAALGLLS
jgi:hypothetical protein